MLAVPQLLISIGIVAACSTTKNGCLGGLIQPGLSIVIAVIVLFTWPYVARVVRGNTLSLREKEFVEASRSLGAGSMRIIYRDVLPNLIAPVIVLATLLIPGTSSSRRRSRTSASASRRTRPRGDRSSPTPRVCTTWRGG